MKDAPNSIKNYLLNLEGDQFVDGYLCLNEKREILISDGWVGITDLGTIDSSVKPEQSIPILEGLLPGNLTVPTVIKHAHIDQDYYFDIHLFSDHFGTWVLFIDKTHSAKQSQKEQQTRLADDFYKVKRHTGS